MGSKLPPLYDVCQCNHESMSHVQGTKKCFTNVPVGKQSFRGGCPNTWATEKCECKKFKFSKENTADPKPSILGEDD